MVLYLRLIRQKVSAVGMVKKILVGLSLLCVLYFSSAAFIGWYRWMQCDQRAWGTFTAWRVIEIDSSQFAIETDYTFVYKGQLYRGSARHKPYPFNRPSAEKEIQIRQAQRPIIYFHSKKPNISMLQREFPLKKCLYALLTVSILGYFLLLDRVYFKQSMKKA